MAKEVKFSHLRINNFKGIKELGIDLSDDVTISGKNATGKSTIFDAITWCLFGKNSFNDTKFNIKNTVDTSLNIADHVVELTMSIDGIETTAKAVYKEKWVKKHGEEEKVFTGNETLYFWNNVPLNAGDYSKKVSEVIEESVFKQITNPLFFNVTMNKNERRDMLVRMAGDDVTDKNVIGTSEAFRALFAKLQGQKSLEEYRKEISFEKIGIKKQLVDIPARIDELFRSNPVAENWVEIQDEINIKEAAIRGINEDIENINKAFDAQLIDIKAQQAKVSEAVRKMSDIKIELSKKSYAEASEANKDLNEAKYKLGIVRSELKSKERQKESDLLKINSLEIELAQLRKDFDAEAEKTFVFDRDACKCPTCQRAFEPATIEEKETTLHDNFLTEQTKQKAIIRANGIFKAEQKTAIENGLLTLTVEISDLQKQEKALIWSETTIPSQPKDIEVLLLTHAQYLLYKAVSETVITVTQPDIAEQKDIQLQIQEGIDQLKTRLRNKEQIEKNAIRIKELKADEKKYSQMLSDLEKSEFTIADFQEKKMNMVESAVNSKFKYVKFNLFKKQVNGGREPDCETVVDGVPFSDLNHAAQLNAGLDCANAISNYYGVSAPIIIDNAESVNTFLPVTGQMIRLYVTDEKTLQITQN